jgi:hypothetical protein
MRGSPMADAQRIFGEALQLPDSAQRDAYLNCACGSDKTLRAEVNSLHCAHEQASKRKAFLSIPCRCSPPSPRWSGRA